MYYQRMLPYRGYLIRPSRARLSTLGALGKFEAKGAPKKHAEKKHVEKVVRGRGRKKAEAPVVPPLVPQAAGISRSCFRIYTDYVVVSDTLEGLGVSGGGAAAGGTSAGSKPADEKKRKAEKAVDASDRKRPKIQTERTAVVKHVVAPEPQGDGFYMFDIPLSPPHDTAADVGVNKDFTRSPSIEVVPEPSVRAEDTGKGPAAQNYDTVDSHDNLISPQDTDDLNLKFAYTERKKSPAAEKASGSASRGAGFKWTPIQPEESELEFYYRTYTEDRAMTYHRPPWIVMQGDDISADPSACPD
ncbi:hypothetical protein Hanom_Chr11g01063841 [Helianthus anomalus]